MEQTTSFTIHSQPVVDIETRAIWYSELFAEYRGIRGSEWAVQDRSVLQWCAARTLQHAPRTSVGVNVPVELLGEVVDACVTAQESGVAVHVEVLETGHIDTGALTAVRAMQQRGVQVLLDDMGAGDRSEDDGYRHRWDGVKIDGDVVRRAFDGDPSAARLVRNMVASQRRVVAEHVEGPGSVATARRFGIRYVQGYATGRPVLHATCQEVEAPPALLGIGR